MFKSRIKANDRSYTICCGHEMTYRTVVLRLSIFRHDELKHDRSNGRSISLCKTLVRATK